MDLMTPFENIKPQDYDKVITALQKEVKELKGEKKPCECNCNGKDHKMPGIERA